MFPFRSFPSFVSVSLLVFLVASGCGDGPTPATTSSVVVPDGPGTTPWMTTTTTVGVQAEPLVGYEARRCGFDLNQNGNRGQGADCHVCDGSTTDVNADGVEDNLVYVDCDREGSGNGGPNSPFATIEEAMDALEEPRDEVIQAVCFRGSCRETIVPRRSGASGHYEIEGFRAPRYPLIVSGWDEDGDGRYPPFDSDDFAELNGNGLDFAIENRRGHSRLEFAHFEARNFGRECPDEGGFMRPALGGDPVKHISVHDVELYNINRECPSASGRAVFLTFLEGSVLEHFLVHNVFFQNYGGYAVRGSGVGTEGIGPYRFDKLTVRPYGPEGGMAHGIKLWDHINGVQIVRSRFEARPDRWNPCPSSVDVEGCEPVFAISAAQCSRDWTIWGNIITDWKYAIEVQPDAGSAFCQTRDMDDIRIQANFIRNTWEPWQFGDFGIRLDAGDEVTVRNVEIRRNYLESTVGWESCIWSNVGVESKEQPGRVRIEGNACVGPVNRYAALMIGEPDNEGGEASNPQHDYDVTGNVFARIDTVNVNTGYDVVGIDLEGNVYDPDAGFGWNHDAAGESKHDSLSEWSKQSGESGSLECRAEPEAEKNVCPEL